ncbi:hypothetical protein D0Z08_04900 [Nocardioides immobilis]|uniref:Uncharacterized protein n=1 Tax=Nocardioides immobilis TaxID=2049295 RepID=A0A417Y6W8_9ACTN|nr:hypothetical protein D0Z08_04900 [Nocardioides immobilis]
MFRSRYMPCENCGESLDRTAATTHECDPERLADYQIFGMRHDIAGFEQKLRDYLDRAHGRFEVWLAAQRVRRKK